MINPAVPLLINACPGEPLNLCNQSLGNIPLVSCFTAHKVTENFRAQGRDPCVAKNQKETNLKMGKQKVLHNL